MKTTCQIPKFFPRKQNRRSAFSLVEVTIAMGLMAFCLVAMLGVLPVGLRQERLSSDQLVAMQVLAAVENDFQNVPAGSTATTRYDVPTNAGSDGSFMVDKTFGLTSVEEDAAYRVSYRVSGPAGTQGALQMHLFIARSRPGELSPQNAAEGIVQQRL